MIEIQKTEPGQGGMDQIKLICNRYHEEAVLTTRSEERPTMCGTIQAMTVTQISTPGFTGTRKYAGLYNTRTSKVLIPTSKTSVMGRGAQTRL